MKYLPINHQNTQEKVPKSEVSRNRSVGHISDGPMLQIDMESEVSEELGEVIVDKETARASYVLTYLFLFHYCVQFLTYLLVLTFVEIRVLNFREACYL